MRRWVLIIAALTLLSPCAGSRASSGSQEMQATLKPGELIPRVATVKQPEQSYALYLPSNYSPGRKWPIVYAFDPAARGDLPVRLMKDAAEKYGYIVAGSNNSRNGQWKQEAEAAQAMVQDTRERLLIDDRRVYFAGFSGGARVSAALAQSCKCAAGVFMAGAGFPERLPPTKDTVFPVFAVVGVYDFNFGEVVHLDDTLRTLGFPHELREFVALHQWPPPPVFDEALAWFRLIAMKQNRESRDDAFVTAQVEQAKARVHSFEQSGDFYASWKENLQAAETFAGLGDNTTFRQRADALKNDNFVRDRAKREKKQIEEQDHLTEDITAGLLALKGSNPSDVRLWNRLDFQITDLRLRSRREKDFDKQCVLRRAIGGVLVEAMEAGAEQMQEDNLPRARQYFQLAVDADPESVRALGNLAVVSAQLGDRKAVIDALRHAWVNTTDNAGFAKWLRDEPAFSRFHDEKDFQDMLAPAKP
jgi:dienelactone hydrolase